MSARTLTGFFAAAGIAVAALFLSAAPAAAHDQLVDTDPPANSTVDAVPDQIVLTYSAEVLADPGAAVVEVTDASGNRVDDGDAVVEGIDVIQPILATAADPNGTYEVVWKVVSSDGHPISGEFTFTVEGVAPEPTPTPTETATTAPTTEPSPTATAVAPPADAESTAGAVWPWVAGGILLAAVAGAVIYLLASRARRTAQQERLQQQADTGGAGPSGD